MSGASAMPASTPESVVTAATVSNHALMVDSAGPEVSQIDQHSAMALSIILPSRKQRWALTNPRQKGKGRARSIGYVGPDHRTKGRLHFTSTRHIQTTKVATISLRIVTHAITGKAGVGIQESEERQNN